jgi:uncharacterized BrkB/YihY/UPF0761 family membrane protein
MDQNIKDSIDKIVDQSAKTKVGKHRLIPWIVVVLALVLLGFFCSCSSSHRVMQSASTYKAGDSVVTTIIYQQSGSLKK